MRLQVILLVGMKTTGTLVSKRITTVVKAWERSAGAAEPAARSDGALQWDTAYLGKLNACGECRRRGHAHH